MVNTNIQRIRKFIGISQRELGRRIKMSGQYIAKIEKGERTPPIDTLKKIASALNVELLEIIDRPKTTIELFWDVIYAKNISLSQLTEDLNIPKSSIKSVLCDYKLGFYPYTEFISLGKYLDFSKGYCEKRFSFDHETLCSMSTLEKNELYKLLNLRYIDWIFPNEEKKESLINESFDLNAKNTSLSIDELNLLNNYNLLNEEGQKKLIEYSKDLIETPKYKK